MTIREKASQAMARREYSFTVVFEPVHEAARNKNGRQARPHSNSSSIGYQVTVPLLPGLITYGAHSVKLAKWPAMQSAAT
jgi:hypothetical protein